MRVASPGRRRVEPSWTATAENDKGGIVHARSEGRPSTGEVDTLACAGRYVRFCRAQRETWWDDPMMAHERTEPWLDCKAADRRDRDAQALRMQVQRAMVGKARYAEWGRDRQTDLPPGTTFEQAAEILEEAIRNKQDRASGDVVLLLDALRLPWLASAEAVAAFRRFYGAWAMELGFQAIYVVPAAETAVSRLDTREV